MQITKEGIDQLSFKSAIAGAALALLIILPVGYKFVQYKIDNQKPLQQIVAIDFLKTVSDLTDDLSDQDQVTKSRQAVDRTIRKLTESGFIVLDSKAVLSAPGTVYISKQVLEGNLE